MSKYFQKHKTKYFDAKHLIYESFTKILCQNISKNTKSNLLMQPKLFSTIANLSHEKRKNNIRLTKKKKTRYELHNFDFNFVTGSPIGCCLLIQVYLGLNKMPVPCFGGFSGHFAILAPERAF